MITKRAMVGALLIGIVFSSFQSSAQTNLDIHVAGSQVKLAVPAQINSPSGERVYPEYTVERSFDLKKWEPVGGKVRGISGISGPLLNLNLNGSNAIGFYRVAISTNSDTTQQTGSEGAEIFGYGRCFSKALGDLGQYSVKTFSTNAAGLSYLPQISWNPTNSRFWTNFNIDWAARSALNPYGPRYPDYRLTSAEMALFKTNGFVVTERLGAIDFNDSYYKLFSADLPLFVSADSVLHAWYRTYGAVLEELEELEMSTLMESMLTNMAAGLPLSWQKYNGNTALRQSVLDADAFVTVALSLWNGRQIPTSLGQPVQEQWVASTLAAIDRHGLEQLKFCGSNRSVDFSQFIVRGHYVNSVRLQRYFRTMMWCGLMDLRLATFAPNKEDDIRQIGTAIILTDLLKKSSLGYAAWASLEKMSGIFVGVADSMTFDQFGSLLTGSGINTPADVSSLSTLSNLQARMLTGELGAQNITGAPMLTPLGPEQIKLPRSFAVCGQKFTIDSWAFNQVTYDRILWPPVGGDKVPRRKPSCLDMAYSVFGNNATVPMLAFRMTNSAGVAFRDNLPYQANLQAVRATIDKQTDCVWSNSLYMTWLSALRALSAPTTGKEYPEAMRTAAWAMKNLNTQLASWTELRHETVLYVKQSNTDIVLCSYPDGYVEPRPEFWQKMSDLAWMAANAINGLELSGTVVEPARPPTTGNATYNLATVKSAQYTCLRNFALQMETLRDISVKELAQQPLSDAETGFLKDTIQTVTTYSYGPRYDGWYPRLYYQYAMKVNYYYDRINQWDAIATDVHTDNPDQVSGDPGAVIHEGIGNVHLMLIAIDNGPDRAIYAGPVLSHYEFEEPAGTRLSDDQWKTLLRANQQPASPEWTRGYLIPGGLDSTTF